MIFSYLPRLLCLCFASFFLLNGTAGFIVRISGKSAIRFAESRPPAEAARFLLVLCMLPFAVATLFVLGLCVPSYLWLEPLATSERINPICAALGLLGAATCFLSLTRTALSLHTSMRHNRLCRLAGSEMHLAAEFSPALVVEDEAPLLALSGMLRPRVLISRGVLRDLSPEELDAALRHEQAHYAACDNAKRLLLLVAPDVFPFVRPLRMLERSWSKFAEWAADDHAAAGDPRHALSLAAALVRVARMGSGPRLPFLSTSLLACDRDLAARVDRLLLSASIARGRARQAQPHLHSASFLLAGCLVALLLAPATLSLVHSLLELLL